MPEPGGVPAQYHSAPELDSLLELSRAARTRPLTPTDLLIAQADGTLDAEVRLQNSYITDSSALVLGSQGTLLVAAESGGPDLPFYAVLDTAGNLFKTPPA